MSELNVIEFVRKPSMELLEVSNPLKYDLKNIATRFHITFHTDITKDHLKQAIINYLSTDYFPRQAESSV